MAVVHKVEPKSPTRRGTVHELGSGIVRLGVERGAPEVPLAVAEEVARLAPEFRAVGADELVLHLDVEFHAQCNFEVDALVVQRLAASGAAMTVSCYAVVAEELGAS